MKNRVKQRVNRKIKAKEERLSKYDMCGKKDLTPYYAVQMIINKEAAIARK